MYCYSELNTGYHAVGFSSISCTLLKGYPLFSYRVIELPIAPRGVSVQSVDNISNNDLTVVEVHGDIG